MAKRKTSTAQVAETLTEEKAVSGGAFRAWLNVYKNIFNFKGRTSRYEFWSFQLINLLVLVVFLIILNLMLVFLFKSRGTAFWGIFLAFIAIQFIVTLPLFVRRLRDTGNLVGKEFGKPLVCGSVLIATLILCNNIIPFIIFVLMLPIGLYFFLYDIFKVFIMAGFAEENCQAFEGLEPRYNDIGHQKRAIKYAVIWFSVVFCYICYFTIMSTLESTCDTMCRSSCILF